MGLTVIYPRAFVVVKALLVNGDANGVTTGLYPRSIKLAYRPHTQANQCDVEVDLSAIPFDPRQLSGVFLTAFMGAVKKSTDSVQDFQFARFCGYADEIEQSRSRDGAIVRITARDLSEVLRKIKPLPVVNTPKYSDTALSAIQALCTSVGLDPSRLEIVDQTGTPSRATQPLSAFTTTKGVSGRIPLDRTASAWDAVERVCGLVGILPKIELEKLILTSPTSVFQLTGELKSPSVYDFYFGIDNSTKPPIDNANTLSVKLTKKFTRNRLGVRVYAFDPVSRRNIYADFPDDAHLPPKKRPPLGPVKHNKAPPPGAQAGATSVKDAPRDVYHVGNLGVQTIDQLKKIAERMYRERSRQELEGEFETVNWDNKVLTGNAIDIFDLRPTNRARVRINPFLEAELRARANLNVQIAFMKERLGMDEVAARFLLGQTDKDVHSLRTITHEWNKSRASTRIDFHNITEIDLTTGA